MNVARPPLPDEEGLVGACHQAISVQATEFRIDVGALAAAF